jgi:hypothetical protein
MKNYLFTLSLIAVVVGVFLVGTVVGRRVTYRPIEGPFAALLNREEPTLQPTTAPVAHQRCILEYVKNSATPLRIYGAEDFVKGETWTITSQITPLGKLVTRYLSPTGDVVIFEIQTKGEEQLKDCQEFTNLTFGLP